MGTPSNYNVLGICAGGGGLLFPFRRHLLGNIEPRTAFRNPNKEQWRLNFGEVPLITGYDLGDFKDVDIIMSSPDCGASSIMRMSLKKTLGDPKENKSINLVIAGIQKYQPRVFLIENLPRLLSFISQSQFQELFPEYKLVFHERSVVDFGNSQVSRKRLVIVGINKNTSREYLNNFNKVFKVDTPKLTRDILEQPKNDIGSIPKNKVLAMYDYRLLPQKKNLTVREIHKLWTKDFKNEKKWPIKTAKMSTLPGVYRLESDKAPLTVRPADRQFRPDGWPITIGDMKNLMGFPEKFLIYGLDSEDEKSYLYWLNKARYTLCKGSVYQVGIWFKRCWLNKI
jgi:site-specific DNA-cytosine methylase